jgi:hypothetical protein
MPKYCQLTNARPLLLPPLLFRMSTAAHIVRFLRHSLEMLDKAWDVLGISHLRTVRYALQEAITAIDARIAVLASTTEVSGMYIQHFSRS